MATPERPGIDYITLIPGRGPVAAPASPAAPVMAAPAPLPAIDPALRRQLDPGNTATDEELTALLAQFPMRGTLPTFQVRPDGSVATGIWDTNMNRLSIANVSPTIGSTLGREQATPEQINASAMGYGALVNPYGNAYMQRLQDMLTGRSEANLQKMNALMSQRGMGGTGLAAARAMQAQSDVGQQLLEAQQQATQQGAAFALNRLAGLTGQQQFGRQQTEAERAGLSARRAAATASDIARQAEQRAQRGQQAELLAPYFKMNALGLGQTAPASTTTGGGRMAARVNNLGLPPTPTAAPKIQHTDAMGVTHSYTPEEWKQKTTNDFNKDWGAFKLGIR